MRQPHVQAFLDMALPHALRAAQATGLPVSVVLAQWALESGWGRTQIARELHNLGAITMSGQPPRYRSYQSLEAFTDDWIRLLMLPLYQQVRTAATAGGSREEVAEELGRSPYAESHYAEAGHTPGWTLVRIIRDSRLAEYDDSE